MSVLDPMLGGGAPTPDDDPLAALLEEEPDPGDGDGITSRSKGDPTDFLRRAISEIEQYLRLEQDDEDLAAGADIIAKLQKLLAANQRMTDQATGAGPGVKLVRKAAAGGGPAPEPSTVLGNPAY